MKRINDTSKRVPKLDGEKIARGLGCSESYKVVSEHVSANKVVSEHISVKIYRKGKVTKRVIRKLLQEQIGYFVLLGTAEGQDINHCIYIACRHCENFWKRAVGFVILPPTIEGMNDGMKIRVEFYEKKK